MNSKAFGDTPKKYDFNPIDPDKILEIVEERFEGTEEEGKDTRMEDSANFSDFTEDMNKSANFLPPRGTVAVKKNPSSLEEMFMRQKSQFDND